jgi:hypothetical protein
MRVSDGGDAGIATAGFTLRGCAVGFVTFEIVPERPSACVARNFALTAGEASADFTSAAVGLANCDRGVPEKSFTSVRLSDERAAGGSGATAITDSGGLNAGPIGVPTREIYKNRTQSPSEK